MSRISRCVNGLFPLLLGLMVLGWGTGYKLSLYYTQNARSAAPAKLCTRASDTAKSELDHAAKGTVVERTTPAWAAVVVSDLELISLRRGENEDGLATKTSLRHFGPDSYRRPPPEHLFLID